MMFFTAVFEKNKNDSNGNIKKNVRSLGIGFMIIRMQLFWDVPTSEGVNPTQNPLSKVKNK